MTGTQIFEGIFGIVAIAVVFGVPLWVEFELGRGLLAIGRGLVRLSRRVTRSKRQTLPRAIARIRT